MVRNIDVVNFVVNGDGSIRKNIYFPAYALTKTIDLIKHENWEVFQVAKDELYHYIGIYNVLLYYIVYTIHNIIHFE